jgi:hypothetical protein
MLECGHSTFLKDFQLKKIRINTVVLMPEHGGSCTKA